MYARPLALLTAAMNEGFVQIEDVQTAVTDADGDLQVAAELVHHQITSGPIDAADRPALARVEAAANLAR